MGSLTFFVPCNSEAPQIKDEAPSAKKEFERAGCDLHDRFAGVWGGSDFQGGQQTLNNDGWSGKAA